MTQDGVPWRLAGPAGTEESFHQARDRPYSRPKLAENIKGFVFAMTAQTYD